MQTQVIQKLDESVINQIAAGEVIERPASVLKELLDNAVDAQATEIQVSLQEAGIQNITVQDNGVGIAKEQLAMVFVRHATSKIRSFEDLINHLGLGFRGEAMAAISSVSNVNIFSRPKEQNQAYSIDYDGQILPCSFNYGTKISVSDLFCKVPARLKFLKSNNTEYRNCLKIFEEYAFAFPEISMQLTHNNKSIYNLSSTDFKTRLMQLFQSQTVQSCLEVQNLAEDCKVSGFIGLPEIAKDRQNYQFLAINGRPLNPAMVATAVKKAYGNRIFPSQRPAFFLNIELPAHHIDVNVHPRKLDARFLMPQQIFSRIYKTVEHSLSKSDLGINLSAKASQSHVPKATNYQSDSLLHQVPSSPSKPITTPSFSPVAKAPSPIFNIPRPSQAKHVASGPVLSKVPLLALAQLKKSYILAENTAGLVLVDQHAAHEKILYQKLRKGFETRELKMQPLLVPCRLELTQSECKLLDQYSETFVRMGIQIERFGGNTVLIQAVADYFAKIEPAKLLQGLLNDLQDPIKPDNLRSIEDIAINYAACRGAIKFGQVLNLTEMQSLLDQLNQIADHQFSCPHGRPTQLKLSMGELEKLFLRTK